MNSHSNCFLVFVFCLFLSRLSFLFFHFVSSHNKNKERPFWWQFTWPRTGLPDAWCYPVGSVSGSCTCLGPEPRSARGEGRSLSPWCGPCCLPALLQDSANKEVSFISRCCHWVIVIKLLRYTSWWVHNKPHLTHSMRVQDSQPPVLLQLKMATVLKCDFHMFSVAIDMQFSTFMFCWISLRPLTQWWSLLTDFPQDWQQSGQSREQLLWGCENFWDDS